MRISIFLFFFILLQSLPSLGASSQADDAFHRRDYAHAFTLYEQAALNGESSAQFMLGILYENGWGTGKDPRKALDWYMKAAEQGHPDSLYNLGVMHFYGNGIPKDRNQGIAYYEEALTVQSSKAAEALGRMHLYGENGKKDPQKASFYLWMATEWGNTQSLYLLAHMYLKGIGVKQDEYAGILMLIEAANKGVQKARDDIQRFERDNASTFQNYLKRKYNHTEPPYSWLEK